MRKILCLLFIFVCSAFAPTARAAFPSCQDARNYGENSARLFVGQAFARIACDGQLLPRVHLGLDRLLARQVLRTSDDDWEKQCFYAGLFEGLTKELRSRYAACAPDPRFACLSGETLAGHAGSLLTALGPSLRAPADLDLEAITLLFESAWADGPVNVCSAAPEDCENSLFANMSSLARALFAQDVAALAQLICMPAADDEGRADRGGGTCDASTASGNANP